ncbi:hypothetical protein DSM02_280 [Leeuwenhoekiella polynyae]|uniref:Uncharacterized protein n=1 Tax=Leeuwenhoekiella polynyae TaxID=1550906 RepID=A0A4Q0PH46_9FLAO|nr:hypothetical protein DSM02_280 [Leeuwenhoekiella polynyae]
MNSKSERQGQIGFTEYPELKIAYVRVQGLRNIFNQAIAIKIAYTKPAH